MSDDSRPREIPVFILGSDPDGPSSAPGSLDAALEGIDLEGVDVIPIGLRDIDIDAFELGSLVPSEEAGLPLRDRLRNELWTRTQLWYFQSDRNAFLDRALSFYDPEVLERADPDPDGLVMVALSGAYKEWLMYDVALDHRTPVERALDGVVSDGAAEILRSWRDSTVSLYRVELVLARSNALIVKDLFRDEEVRIDDEESLYLFPRGLCFIGRLIRRGRRRSIEGTYVPLGGGTAAMALLLEEWEAYAADSLEPDRDAFLKASGHLAMRLCSVESLWHEADAAAARGDGETASASINPCPLSEAELASRMAAARKSDEPAEKPTTDPDDPCPCGSGKKYAWCCLWTEPWFLRGLDELANLPPAEGPVDRPSRWQATMITYPGGERSITSGEPVYLVMGPKVERPIPGAIEPVAAVPRSAEDRARLYCDTLLDCVDGYVDELPVILEVRDAEVGEALEALFGEREIDVRVERGTDFEALSAVATGLLTDMMTGGRAFSD